MPNTVRLSTGMLSLIIVLKINIDKMHVFVKGAYFQYAIRTEFQNTENVMWSLALAHCTMRSTSVVLNSGIYLLWHHAPRVKSELWIHNSFAKSASLSCANLFVTDGNTISLDDLVTMLVVLCMNVKFTRVHYANLIVKQPWKMTIVDWSLYHCILIYIRCPRLTPASLYIRLWWLSFLF